MTDPVPPIPDAAVEAAGEALTRHMLGRNLEYVPKGATLDAVSDWMRAIDMAAEEAMPVVLAAALPHLVTDEAVERAARAVHEVSDDVLPFDLGPSHDPQRSAKWNATRSTLLDKRRKRYLTIARAALEAVLGGPDA